MGDCSARFARSIPHGSRRNEHLELEALVDPLTSLLNRRAWDRLLAREEERCRRYGHTATVFVIDLDQLKEVNDAAGHAAGDALLVHASSPASVATSSA